MLSDVFEGMETAYLFNTFSLEMNIPPLSYSVIVVILVVVFNFFFNSRGTLHVDYILPR